MADENKLDTAALDKKLAALEKENADLKKENASLKVLVEKSNEAISELEQTKSETRPTLKHGGKTYIVTITKSRFQGRDITPEVLKADPKLVEQLLKRGSGILRELKAKGGK